MASDTVVITPHQMDEWSNQLLNMVYVRLKVQMLIQHKVKVFERS